MAINFDIQAQNALNIVRILEDYLSDTEKQITYNYINPDNEVETQETINNLIKVLNTIVSDSELLKYFYINETGTVVEDRTINFIDTRNEDLSITFPENPIDNEIIILIDNYHNAENHPVTVDFNGKKFNNEDNNLICDVNGFMIVLTYSADTDSWYLINQTLK